MLRKIAENINRAPEFVGTMQYNISMREHTSFRVGGPAEIFITPMSQHSFLFVIHYLQNTQQNYVVLGQGSNIVVSDKGISGFVISTAGLDSIEYKTDTKELRCGAGCTFEKITQFCIENSLSGIEAFAGLPGSVGGAVFMNARCYNCSISDILVATKYVNKKGSLSYYTMNNKDWAYKTSPFNTSLYGTSVITAHFSVREGNQNEIQNKSTTSIENRRKKGHYTFPSAGSVFKNNRAFGKPSGQLIDEAGLKGTTCGGAQVAPWHGNFIVNTGTATADDIKKLVEQVTQEVLRQTGFELECEIIFYGD
ncbi:MAG TPA: UDP-N-acetylmuramate dehydrogenase [Treponemataceae bacterium]|nr:UDP-N-acetylmuramate dehydrogenase [Treponemataceae bacterium]